MLEMLLAAHDAGEAGALPHVAKQAVLSVRRQLRSDLPNILVRKNGL